MTDKFGRSLFGLNPSDVKNKIENMNNEHQQRVALLKQEIEQATNALRKSEELTRELQEKINYYLAKEHSIAEVMLIAQKKAARTLEAAQEKARMMLLEVEEELQQKSLKLENLQKNVALFKEEFKEILDKYRFSLDTIRVSPPEESSFIPRVISKEKPKVDIMKKA